jgi:hypothetical protein
MMKKVIDAGPMTVPIFEELLMTTYKHYIEMPQLFVPGSNRDAEYYSPEAFVRILEHDDSGLVRLVRKRSEQSGSKSYYFKDNLGVGYFKIVVPDAATGSAVFDFQAFGSGIRQFLDTLKIRLGMY